MCYSQDLSPCCRSGGMWVLNFADLLVISFWGDLVSLPCCLCRHGNDSKVMSAQGVGRKVRRKTLMTPRTLMMMMVDSLRHQKNAKEKQETPETPRRNQWDRKPESRLGPEDALVFPGSTSERIVLAGRPDEGRRHFGPADDFQYSNQKSINREI